MLFLICLILAGVFVDPNKLPISADLKDQLHDYQADFARVNNRLSSALTSFRIRLECAFLDRCRFRVLEQPELEQVSGSTVREAPARPAMDRVGLMPCTDDTVRNRSARAAACREFLNSGKGTQREKAQAATSLGFQLQFLERFADATAAWDEAIVIDDNYAEPYIAKGEWLLLANDPLGALALFNTGAANDSRNIRAFVGLGRASFELGNHKNAVAAFEKAVALDPANEEANYYMGRVLETVGAFSRAADYYERAIPAHL